MSGFEIERKFLIAYPEKSEIMPVKSYEILQTYLKRGADGSQRRVRRIVSEGKTGYTYTEKVFLTAVTREERERVITEEEYITLLKEARKDCVPIDKTRWCVEYKGQLFEIDMYPFSDKLAVMELELENENQQIIFPEGIDIIKEVTEDSRYANAALANAGGFPV